jgi:hypothetical protein
MPPKSTNKNSVGRAKAAQAASSRTVAPRTSQKPSANTSANKNVNPLDPMRGRPGVLPAPVIKLPVAGSKVSQQFGNVPSNQSISYASKTNLGTDFAASAGSNIMSIVDGEVVGINPNSGAWGNQLIVRDAKGGEQAYNHMAGYGDVKVGQKVKAGDVLGQVGSTGQTTGPHLDLETTVNGTSVPLDKAFPGYRFEGFGGAEKGVEGAQGYNRSQKAFYNTSDLSKSTGSSYAYGSGTGTPSASGVGTTNASSGGSRSGSFSAGTSASSAGFGGVGQQVNLGALNQSSMRKPRSTRVSITTPTLLAPITPTQTSNPGTVTTSKSL